MSYKDSFYGDRYVVESDEFDDVDEILQEMQQCASKLLRMGVPQKEIEESLFDDRQRLHLMITEGHDIVLFRYSGKLRFLLHWIKLSPLDKAVYFLFLRHPEGINFSCLPDYRDELMEIYKKLMNYRTTASMLRSVEDVTDPTKNSINEKCARIRRAFVEYLGAYKANKYCITGKRGEVKRITLDRNSVVWLDGGKDDK
jgi:hypothetical protein